MRRTRTETRKTRKRMRKTRMRKTRMRKTRTRILFMTLKYQVFLIGTYLAKTSSVKLQL